MILTKKRINVDRNVLTGVERVFLPHEIVVTKTDLKGHITYANDVFVRLAGYPEDSLIGAAHSIIRHPHMPRGVFRLLWDTLKNGEEVFAYVLNRSMNGDHYWVLAHVTPSQDETGRMVGYHSNRRVADKRLLETSIQPLYAAMLREEAKHTNAQAAADAGMTYLSNVLEQKGARYDEFIFSLMR